MKKQSGSKIFQDRILELDINALARGIGRKATDEELIHYLSKNKNAPSISIDEAFAKYSKQK